MAMVESVVYLDNAATTRPCDASVEAALRVMRSGYGNPSSLHALGAQAARELAAARDSVAAVLGCESESVCFTSGGSESNQFAVVSGARARARAGKRVVSTAMEHASLHGALAQLEHEGFEIIKVPLGADGNVDPDAVLAAVDDKTALVSVMHVNNETGAIIPVDQIAALLRARYPRLLIHSDGVQAFGKLPLHLARTQIDLYSISGHKVCAPKGAGALYIRRGVCLAPYIAGGGQERGLRGGTEAMPAIAALGAACMHLKGRQKKDFLRAQSLMTQLEQMLGEIPEVCINSPRGHTPYILSFSVPGWRGETLVHALERRGVFVSSGSACSKGADSPVLEAMGFDRRRLEGALRVSFCYDTEDTAIDRLAEALRESLVLVAHR